MRILIMMSDTGGGHRSCAIALQQEFARLEPGRHQAYIADVYRACTPRPFNLMPDVYPLLLKHCPRLWQWTFRYYGSAVPEEFMGRVLRPYCQPYFELLLRAYEPDLILTVNPLLHPVLFRVLEALGRDIPVATVISDLLQPHSSWFHAKLDRCFVPTAQAAVTAKQARVPNARIRVYGLPVRREFIGLNPDKAQWKRALGFCPDQPLVLLLGGGEGISAGAPLVARLVNAMAAKRLPALQLAIICGRNEALRARLQSEYAGAGVRVEGYTEAMHMWMAASDCAVTKAGPNTIMEAAAAGLPVILNHYISGQEELNPDFVVRRQMGCYAAEPGRQVQILKEWLESDSALAQLAVNARNVSTAHAGELIAKELVHQFA